jgi:hypothetical protein
VAVEAPPAFLGDIEKLVGQRQREGLGELSCKPGTRLELVTPSLPLAVVGRRICDLILGRSRAFVSGIGDSPKAGSDPKYVAICSD